MSDYTIKPTEKALALFKELDKCKTKNEIKEKIRKALDE